MILLKSFWEIALASMSSVLLSLYSVVAVTVYRFPLKSLLIS